MGASLQSLRGLAAEEKKRRKQLEKSVCGTVSSDTLRALASRGGLAALIDAAHKAEKQFRWYGDLHAAKPDLDKAARNYEYADMLRALLPQTGEGETEPATPTAMSDGERERAWTRGAATALHALVAGFREVDLAQRVANEIQLSTQDIENCGLEPSTAARVIDALSKREDG